MPIRSLGIPFLLLALSLYVGGCSGNVGGLTLTSLENRHSYQQTFSNAYLSRNANGDLDIVLVDDATERSLDGHATPGEVHQIMHLRILFNPTRDMRASDAAVCNASIHWYVLGQGKGARSDVVEYAGTGWVSTASFNDLVRVSVQNAAMKPVRTRGLQDPVGPSRIEGAVFAHPNRERVAQLLAEIRTTVVASK